jgi:methylated-DNA-[protein]-cysteine S-methyltransferase
MLPFYFAYYESPLGWLRIKATEQNIYEVFFSEEAGRSDLHQPLVIHQCIQQLDEYFSAERKTFDLPLNPDGTTFQQQVWDELKHIPYGQTLSYLDMARKMGDEKKIRAMANANGKNPVAIIIPCHRVIGSNGSLVGYAGGLKRKQWLLDHEAKVNGVYSRLF